MLTEYNVRAFSGLAVTVGRAVLDLMNGELTAAVEMLLGEIDQTISDLSQGLL